MSDRLRWLNTLPAEEAQAELLRCCGSTRWARQVVEDRPFESFDALLAAADRIWWSLEAEDWLEAFSHHPRIGEREAPDGWAATQQWSSQEQEGAQRSPEGVRAALAAGNREYEERFGYTYIVCATGKSGEEMLRILQERLHNDPATELHAAAEEQRKITHLRLEKLLKS